MTLRGSCYKSLGQKDEALNDLERSLKFNQSYGRTLYEISDYYLQQKDIDSAIKYLDQYLYLEENRRHQGYSTIAKQILPYVNLLSQNEQCGQAADYFDKASRYYGTFYQDLKSQNITSVWPWFIMLFDPEATDTLGDLSLCLAANGLSDRAINILNNRISQLKEETEVEYKSADNLSVNNDAWVRYGYRLLAMLYRNLAMIYTYSDNKQYDKAIIAYNDCVEACDKCLSEAPLAANLSKSAELFGANSSGIEALAYWNRANIYMELGQDTNAIRDARKASSLGSQDAYEYMKTHSH
jgi:tetratricopeptide (TPR) repeat protein